MIRPSAKVRASLEALEMSKGNVNGEVARLMNAGLSPDQIATRMGRTISRVRAYVDSLKIISEGSFTLPALSQSAREQTTGHVRRLTETLGSASLAEQQNLAGLVAELAGR